MGTLIDSSHKIYFARFLEVNFCFDDDRHCLPQWMIELRGTCSIFHLVINVALVDENCFGVSESVSCCIPTWSKYYNSWIWISCLFFTCNLVETIAIRRPRSQAKPSLTHNFSSLYVVFYITTSSSVLHPDMTLST